MARLRDGRHHLSVSLDNCRLALLIGPISTEPTEDELRLAWELICDDVMLDAPIGARPWGCWRFEIGEERPGGGADAETLRLGELGLLTSHELAAFRERATEARLRVGTDRERISGGNRESGVSMDAAAIKLWERLSVMVGDGE